MAANISTSVVDSVDRQIVQLRALGFKQQDIADRLDISQASVSQRLEAINQIAKSCDNLNRLFLDIALGDTGITLLEMLVKRTGMPISGR